MDLVKEMIRMSKFNIWCKSREHLMVKKFSESMVHLFHCTTSAVMMNSKLFSVLLRHKMTDWANRPESLKIMKINPELLTRSICKRGKRMLETFPRTHLQLWGTTQYTAYGQYTYSVLIRTCPKADLQVLHSEFKMHDSRRRLLLLVLS